MGARTETRERMLRAAVDLLAERGYEGFGVLDVVARANASRGSIYFHFPDGKDQIVLEAMHLASQRRLDHFGQAVRGATDTATAVRETGLFLATVLEASDYTMGCPIAAVTLDVTTSHDQLRRRCANFFRSWQSLYLGSLLRDGVDRTRAERIAMMIVASLEGAMVLALAQRSAHVLIDVSHECAELCNTMPSSDALTAPADQSSVKDGEQ